MGISSSGRGKKIEFSAGCTVGIGLSAIAVYQWIEAHIDAAGSGILIALKKIITGNEGGTIADRSHRADAVGIGPDH